MLPGKLLRLVEAGLCVANTIERDHNILGCSAGPLALLGGIFLRTLGDFQETPEGAHEMKLGDATTSVAPSGFLQVSMKLLWGACGVETV